MATELNAGAHCALLLTACGCFAPRGLVLTHTTVPYALPEEAAGRTGTKSCSVKITQLKEPLSQFNLSVMWGNRAVADAMQKAGMSEIRYADLQTLSILNSVYERRLLVFYGE